MKLVIATKNKNKIIEIREKFFILNDLEILSLDDFEDSPDVIEDGATFEENALKKAREISIFAGLPVLADDSGLEIDALKGEPGVYSARFAGKDATDAERNSLILERMKDIPDNKRKARFVCMIAIVLPDGREYLLRGVCEGVIAHKMKGLYGFGYDPIFYLPKIKKTMAELTLVEKNRISHRAKALELAQERLQMIFR